MCLLFRIAFKLTTVKTEKDPEEGWHQQLSRTLILTVTRVCHSLCSVASLSMPAMALKPHSKLVVLPQKYQVDNCPEAKSWENTLFFPHQLFLKCVCM